MLQEQYRPELRAASTVDALELGDDVIFVAPSGKRYWGWILEIDHFCGMVQIMVEFTFQADNRMIRSCGWQTVDKVQKAD